MTVKLLTQQHLEFLSLKGGCTGWSESTLVKMPHFWKSHVKAQLYSNAFQTTFGHESKHYEPRSDCSSGSLFWVHTVCNIGFQSVQTDKRADDRSHDWWEMGKDIYI